MALEKYYCPRGISDAVDVRKTSIRRKLWIVTTIEKLKKVQHNKGKPKVKSTANGNHHANINTEAA